MTRPLLILGGLSLAATAAFGQDWNRQITGIAITPGEAGLHDVHVAWTFSVGPSSVPLNLGVVIELRRNGITYAAQPHDVQIAGGSGICGPGKGCAGSCGSSTIDGLANDLFCVPDECDCRPLDLTSTFYGVDLQPGDQVSATLFPGSGALPEPDPAGDTRSASFDGDPQYWDRAVTGVAALRTGEDMYDIYVGLHLYSRYDAEDGLASELLLLVNGAPLWQTFSPFDDFTIAACPSGCMSSCAFDSDGLPRGQCEIIGEPPEPWMNPPCPCATYYGVVVPGVVLVPGDEISVILRPAPGALPELPVPGFMLDDGFAGPLLLLGDLNCDGALNAFDVDPFVLALTDPDGYGAAYPACDRLLADVNGDGEVNAFDIDAFVGLLTG